MINISTHKKTNQTRFFPNSIRSLLLSEQINATFVEADRCDKLNHSLMNVHVVILKNKESISSSLKIRVAYEDAISDSLQSLVQPKKEQIDSFEVLTQSTDCSGHLGIQKLIKLGEGSIEHNLWSKIVIPRPLINRAIYTADTSNFSTQNREIQNNIIFLQPINIKKDDKNASDMKNRNSFSLIDFKMINIEVANVNYEIQMFGAVYQFIKQLFKGEFNSEQFESLDQESLIIGKTIIEKKFKTKLSMLNDIRKFQTQFSTMKFKKRAEECKKLVIGFSIKKLKLRLRNSLNCQYKKSQFDEYFYNYYFGAAAKKEGLPIKDFYYPIVSVEKKLNSARTLNKGYLRNINKSDLFVNDFEEYVSTQFVIDYGKEIDSKLYDLISKWEFMYKCKTSTDDWDKTLKTHLGLYKSKLPWTLNEINGAVLKVKKILM